MKIAITLGDCASIGFEIIVKILQNKQLREEVTPVIIAHKAIFCQLMKQYSLNESLVQEWQGDDDKNSFYIDSVASITPFEVELGKVDQLYGKYAYDTIVYATKKTLQKEYDAIVTAPVAKESINLTYPFFTGHTELIASLCQRDDFVMMQSHNNLRFVFATCHIPYREVTNNLNQARIELVANLLYKNILQEKKHNIKIAVAGLNPHAGEGGFMGTEEQEYIIPAINHLNKKTKIFYGPYPSDTLFLKHRIQEFDGFVCMYHDQGHIPFKMLAFDKGVNSTLNLPIIRTSVDHGTAFDIVGKMKADEASLLAAIKLAMKRIKSE